MAIDPRRLSREGIDPRDYQRLAHTTLELPEEDTLAEANREAFADEVFAAAKRLREVAERFERLAYPGSDLNDPRIPDYIGAADRAIDALMQSHVLAASRFVRKAVDARDTHREWLEAADAQD